MYQRKTPLESLILLAGNDQSSYSLFATLRVVVMRAACLCEALAHLIGYHSLPRRSGQSDEAEPHPTRFQSLIVSRARDAIP